MSLRRCPCRSVRQFLTKTLVDQPAAGAQAQLRSRVPAPSWGSLGQATGSRDSFLQTSPAKELGGKRSSSRKQRPSPELDSNLFELGTVRLPCEVNEPMLLKSMSRITNARHRTSALWKVLQIRLALAGGTTRSSSQDLNTFPGCTHLPLRLCKEA